MTEQKRILIAVMITSFIGPFMGSSVNIAVPAMAENFNMMPDELTWAVTAFLIGSAATLLPFGRLADIKGRRRIYLQGLACICATTLVCAVVQNFLAFIFVRFLQGLSMSMIFGTSMALLVSCCGAENRGKTIGLSAACVYSGVSLGPFIGGFITDYLGWRMIFWLTGIALLINFFLIFKVKTDWYGAKDKKFDYIGSIIIYVTVVLAVICIFYTKMRAGLFMLIFGIPAFWKFKGKQFITLFVGCVVLLFIVFPLISDQIDVFQSLFNKKAQEDVGGSNLEMRLEQLGACVFFLQQSPITGFGEQCLLYLNGIQAYQLRALESVVFEEMVRHGILGLLATFVLMFFTTIHLPLKYHSKELFFVSLSFWVTYILTSIPFFRMHLFYIAYFYIIFQINKRKNIKRNKK